MTEQAQEAEQPEVEQQTEQANESEVTVSPAEAKAREKGWVSLEEWEEQGKSPDDWVTARHFNERGEWFNQKKHFEGKLSEFDKRLAQNNMVWKATLEEREKELKSKRDDLIELADKDGVKAIDAELEKINGQKKDHEQVGPSPEDVAAENAWAAQNQWIQGKTAKAIFAQHKVAELSKLYSGQSLVEQLEKEIESEFPTTNPNREKPSITDKSNPAPSGKGKKYTSVDQLSGTDKSVAQSLLNNGMKEKDIIQMLNDREKK